MTKRDEKAVAKTALANLAKALVGVGSGALGATGAPVLALVTKVFGDSLVDAVKTRQQPVAPAEVGFRGSLWRRNRRWWPLPWLSTTPSGSVSRNSSSRP